MSEREFAREDDARIAEALGLEPKKEREFIDVSTYDYRVRYVDKDGVTFVVCPPYLTAPTWETDAEVKQWVREQDDGCGAFVSAWQDEISKHEGKPFTSIFLWEQPGDAAKALLAVLEEQE